MQLPNHQTRWEATLNNGKVLTEGKDFIKTDNQPLPFKQLLASLEKDSLQIASLVLVTPTGTRVAVPSLNNSDPKARRFDMAEKPKHYRVEYFYAQDKTSAGVAEGAPDWFTLLVAEYQEYELQVWVNENDFNDIRTLVTKNHAKTA